MKNALAAIVLIAIAATASAGWRNDLTGERAAMRPSDVVYAGCDVKNADAATLAAAGWREDTAQELADEAAAAQAQAEAQAEAQALVDSLPATFDTGVAVLGADGHWLELVPVGNDVVPVQISNSPLDPATRAAMKAAAVAAATTNLSTWRDDNRALRSSLATNAVDAQAIRDSLSPTSTTAQVRSGVNALAREHDQLVSDVRKLRRLLTKYAKENDQ